MIRRGRASSFYTVHTVSGRIGGAPTLSGATSRTLPHSGQQRWPRSLSPRGIPFELLKVRRYPRTIQFNKNKNPILEPYPQNRDRDQYWSQQTQDIVDNGNSESLGGISLLNDVSMSKLVYFGLIESMIIGTQRCFKGWQILTTSTGVLCCIKELSVKYFRFLLSSF